MRKQKGVAWVRKTIVEEMTVEAERAFPAETGGVLLGYWARPHEELVITRLIGPGPNAVHKASGFVPDADYQEAEIASCYAESGRLHTYLGDWHTHPNSLPDLSRKDRRTFASIAHHSEARMPVPVMAVLGGPPWALKIWKANPLKAGGAKILFRTEPLTIQIYT
jgi:integrative and conjugative element protein (TIGR02256 family)